VNIIHTTVSNSVTRSLTTPTTRPTDRPTDPKTMFGRLLSRSSNNGLGSYEEIPDHHHHHHHGRRGDSAADNNNGDFPPRTSSSLMKSVMLGMVALLVGIIVVQGVYVREESEELMVAEAVNRTPDDDGEDEESGVVGAKAAGAPRAPPPPHVVAEQRSFPVPMPFGVNLGSWLSLEDYFFAGLENSKEVATPDDKAVAACLPPLHLGSRTGRNWQSETDLFAQLIRENGAAHAVRVFAAHRASFVDLETDLERLASVGVDHVRIPISWCLTDVDPTRVDLSSYGSDDAAILEDFACVDPFYSGGGDDDDDSDDDEQPVLWPAVPRPLIESVLRACANAGLKASLDVHTLPGGTSPGTFSGVWPKRPRFWNRGGDGVLIDGDPSVHPGAVGFGIGHDLLRDLVAWMEDLADRDPVAFAGLKGISPMNEPAHLAAFSHKKFLPPLPESFEGDYERSMAIPASDPDANPSGPALRVFRWFDTALEIFRGSELPDKGVDFQANIIETIITNKSLGPATQFELIARWWCAGGNRTTTPEERSTWATLDVHHYLAWSGDFCSGTVDGQNAAYTCSDAEGRARTLNQQCGGFSPLFRQAIDNQCGPGAKLMSGEFSPASHHTVRRSCTDLASLRDSYLMQVGTASDNDVELYHWSYKMPYGGVFRDAGWSFTQLMYRFGMFDRPDEPSFPCGTSSSSSLPEFGGGDGGSGMPLDLP